MEFMIADWRLLQLTLEDVGPFRAGPTTFSFLGETAPLGTPPGELPGPSNLYMLIAPNGQGKTTVLEAIYGLFGLLNSSPEGIFSDPSAGGRAQIDVRGTWLIDGVSRPVLLSIWTGAREPLIAWSQDRLELEAEATDWATLSLSVIGGQVQTLEETNELGRILFRTLRAAAGQSEGDAGSLAERLPTVLYFPADRSVVAPADRRIVARPRCWGYQPAHRFSHDGPDWESSIDNLLVWLEWVDSARLQDLLERVNDYLFGEDASKRILRPDRSHLLTFVSTPTSFHPLSSLSHGERALLQMFVRVFTQSTQSTVLLIDEIELHLHTRWMNRMFRSFKGMLEETPGLALIFTTHDRELIEVFEYERPENGLTKGGFLIPKGMA
jgi:energy-coupling factor transporter ATP-binding protein EcfA2